MEDVAETPPVKDGDGNRSSPVTQSVVAQLGRVSSDGRSDRVEAGGWSLDTFMVGQVVREESPRMPSPNIFSLACMKDGAVPDFAQEDGT
ncbi:hypothetical protein QJS10_CPA07g00682 [Acorus calamus]|uniref:Uncharacterized protein n=1 Tax=Acorus calamus TaxID=4465 RepID=A0AAV9EGE7_ACOCL|nr:hypothetical protein QJS10_CPA07g00682 [Acorus calamus]